MRILSKKLLTAGLALALCLSGLALPAKQADAAKAYTITTIPNTKVVTGPNAKVTVDCHYTYVQFKGSTKAVKAINKKLKPKNYKKILNDTVKQVKEWVNDMNEDITYYYHTEQAVTYTSKKYVSVYAVSSSFLGGVENQFPTGYTFNRKTGKQIKKITDVTKAKTLSKVKAQLKKKIESDENYYDASELDNMKATDFHFYITKKGNVCVCFGAYELGAGGWIKKYTIPGNVK